MSPILQHRSAPPLYISDFSPCVSPISSRSSLTCCRIKISKLQNTAPHAHDFIANLRFALDYIKFKIGLVQFCTGQCSVAALYLSMIRWDTRSLWWWPWWTTSGTFGCYFVFLVIVELDLESSIFALVIWWLRPVRGPLRGSELGLLVCSCCNILTCRLICFFSFLY